MKEQLEQQKGRGGARVNAGRKAKAGPSVDMHLTPEADVVAKVDELRAQLVPGRKLTRVAVVERAVRELHARQMQSTEVQSLRAAN